MKKKQIFLTIALIMFAFLTQAQDKYQVMVIEFDRTLKNEIQISIEGKEYIQEKADYGTTLDQRHNATPILKKINEYQDKGWELMNMQSLNNGAGGDLVYYFAYLRKKKADQK
jgi:hypothetical protein